MQAHGEQRQGADHQNGAAEESPREGGTYHVAATLMPLSDTKTIRSRLAWRRRRSRGNAVACGFPLNAYGLFLGALKKACSLIRIAFSASRGCLSQAGLRSGLEIGHFQFHAAPPHPLIDARR